MEKLNTLFAALIVNGYNMKMLHWGSTGRDFDTYHELASEYYDKFDEFADDIAEILLMTSDRVPTLTECINILAQSSDAYTMVGTDTQNITSDCFLENVSGIFSQMIKLYEDVSHDVSADIESKFHEHIYWIRKELMYKTKNRK